MGYSPKNPKICDDYEHRQKDQEVEYVSIYAKHFFNSRDCHFKVNAQLTVSVDESLFKVW